jgi:autophagy-related protein 16
MQADKMNAMNDMYQTVTQAQRKAEQQQQQRDRKISSMDLTDSNSILDNVAWSNFFNVSIPTKKSRVLKAHRGSCTSIAYSPKGTMLASGGADSIVRIWDSRNFTACATLKGSRGGIMKVAFSPDNEFLAAVGNDKCGYVWAMRNSKLVNTFTGHLNKVYACAFSSDSDKLITGSHDRTLRIWDVHSQKFEVKSCVSACNNLAVSPNGDLLATGHMDRHVRFWSQNTYEMIHDLGEIHYQQVTSVSFSTDGGTVLTCSRDNTVKLVDTRTWKVLKTYTGTVKQEFVNGCNWNTCCFSPDGQYVLAGSSDGSVFVWNADSAEIETVLVSDEEGALEAKRARSSSDAARERQSLNPFTITGSVWNSNGKQFATCANDGKVTFWGS